MKTPLEMLVRILCNGGEVTHRGILYAMSEDGSLCVIYDKDKDINIRVDCDIRGLNKMAEEIGKDELWLQCCALTLLED